MAQQINNIIAKMQMNKGMQVANYESEAERFAAEPFHITMPYETAIELLKQGIKALWGDKGQWLDGYPTIAKWLSDSNYKWLLIKGNLGRGKTMLMWYMINYIIKPWYNAKMYNYLPKKAFPIIYPQTMLTQIKEQGRMIIGNHFFTAFDDFGKEYDKFDKFNPQNKVFKNMVLSDYDYERDNFFSKALVLTTNLSDDEIAEYYGDAVLSRLYERAEIAMVVGEDLRIPANTEPQSQETDDNNIQKGDIYE